MSMDPATVLEEAADLLLIHGRHRKGGRDPETGALCVVGAIAEAVCPGWYKTSHTAYWGAAGQVPGWVEAIAARVTPYGVLDVAIADWNDFTEDDDTVRDTLLLAAKDLRNETTA